MQNCTPETNGQQPQIDGITPYFPPDLENYAPWVAKHGLYAPYGRCQCGCNQFTKIAKRSTSKEGTKTGCPQRHTVGHKSPPMRGKPGPNPSGLCMCGCGTPTPLAASSRAEYGHVRGEPISYIHGHRPIQDIDDRFWAKADRTGGPNSCWIWQGVIGEKGYGKFRIGDRMITASRVAWDLTNGPIPDDLWVLHNCPGGDNPACVNPAHLWLGDVQDNTNDMMNKDRQNPPQGERHHRATLTNQQVVDFRIEFNASDVTMIDFARSKGIGYKIMHRLLTRETYKHLP